ncbi:MAG TPA: (2Fe-2S)-binding protein [Gaiellaceae bacterium]|nr:(2Fe-2S)-binding protein [Gaiellaceae bacterium]
MSERLRVWVTVNGEAHEALVEPRRTLADFVRHDLGLTGTHVACEHGVCGACTVLVDGEPARSCLMLAVQADGTEVETVEGVAAAGVLHPLQQAFRDTHAFQCGFCTPGFVMSGLAFLREHPAPTREEVAHAASSNLCRCSGYLGIVEGIELAAARLAAGAGEST